MKDTTILSVSVEGQDPKLVTAIANKVADFQRASVEDGRDAGTRGAVLEYVKKMADMSSEMSAISQNIWTRANSAHIPSLTFNEQQKDSRVIVAAFQGQQAALLAQRADIRKELDLSAAELASAETTFDAECISLMREAAPEAMPAAVIEASPKPASAGTPAAVAPAAPTATAQASGSAAAVTSPTGSATAAIPAKSADKPPAPPVEAAAPSQTSGSVAVTASAESVATTAPAKPARNPAAAAVARTSGSAAAATTPAGPAATAIPAKPAEKPAEPKAPMVTAAQFAALYQQLLKVEAEAEKAASSAPENSPGNPQMADLEKKHAEIMIQIENLRRQFQLQSQPAQQTFQEQAAAQERLARQAERISQIEDELEARKLSLTPETYSQDFQVKALQERKATLEAQLETDRAKLNADMAHLAMQSAILPQMLDEAQKIQQLEKSAVSLRVLRMSRKIYRENYDAIQAALDALTGPLNDILNESEKYTRLDEAYLKMDEWVRDVKLALSQISVTVYEATEPTIPIRPKWPINIALSGMLGLMASFGVVMLLEFGRKTVKTPSDAQAQPRRLRAGRRAAFPRTRFRRRGVLAGRPEGFARRRDVQRGPFLPPRRQQGQPPRSILVTSAAAREGKTTVSTLLAHSLARSGEKVLLVDANLRLPYLHPDLPVRKPPRPRRHPARRRRRPSCIRPTGIENLSIMTAGAAGEDGLAWVQPERFAQFVRAAGESLRPRHLRQHLHHRRGRRAHHGLRRGRGHLCRPGRPAPRRARLPRHREHPPGARQPDRRRPQQRQVH